MIQELEDIEISRSYEVFAVLGWPRMVVKAFRVVQQSLKFLEVDSKRWIGKNNRLPVVLRETPSM